MRFWEKRRKLTSPLGRGRRVAAGEGAIEGMSQLLASPHPTPLPRGEGVFSLVILFLFFSFPCFSQPAVHAIAMHGQPLYGPDFTHFEYANPQAPKGGTLRRAEVGTFDNLNPFLITGRVPPALQEALLLTYDTLMTRGWDEPFTMYGLVAQRVALSAKRDTITFYLDKDAKFQDGHPITVKDVQFSFETLKKYGRPNQRRIYKLVTRVTTPDTHTIRFDFGPGYDRETAFILANMPVLPAHYWQGKDFSKTTLVAPLTSGPYGVETVDPGRRVVFKRNADYWAKDKAVAKGLYNFDRLQYDFYRDDKIALQAFAAGQADLRREWSAPVWKRDYDFAAVRDGSVQKHSFKNGRPARARFLVYNMRRPLFRDIRVRQALAYAFNFEWLNKNLFLDTQTRISSIFMNSELASPAPPALPRNANANEVRDNLRAADRLLNEAGYHLHNGMRDMAFEILLNDPQDEKIALEFSRTLKRLGAQATIRTVDTSQYIGRLSQFDYDMTVNFWRNTLSPGTEQAVYWGSAAADQPGSFNYSGLKSDTVDGLIAQLTAAETRQGLVTVAQKLDAEIMRQWIGIPLFDAPDDHIAARANVHFPDKTPLYGPVLESWWYSDEKSAKTDPKDPHGE